MNSLQELKGITYVNTNEPIKKSKGELFKEKHGMSLTMAKNIRRGTGLSPDSVLITVEEIDEYKIARKARKKSI